MADHAMRHAERVRDVLDADLLVGVIGNDLDVRPRLAHDALRYTFGRLYLAGLTTVPLWQADAHRKHDIAGRRARSPAADDTF